LGWTALGLCGLLDFQHFHLFLRGETRTFFKGFEMPSFGTGLLRFSLLATFVLAACSEPVVPPAAPPVAANAPVPPADIAVEEEIAPDVSYPRDLARFQGGGACYNRASEPFTAVVDSHNHFRPFGGAPIPFPEMVEHLKRSGVLFANLYGIGQSLPTSSTCEYYLDCVGTPALPSVKNDFANAQDLLDYDPQGIVLTLSMTFPDLQNPEGILDQIALVDREFPNMFRWMGEVNVVKQALFGNAHEAATEDDIRNWAPFMAVLRERGIPLALHMDLGNVANHTEFLPLMEFILNAYPDNDIVWMHMGLSNELKVIDPAEHIALLSRLLEAHPKLFLDISWRVIYDNYFVDPVSRAAYVAFLNAYPTRILPGTDFVALHTKTYDIYLHELRLTSDILKDVDDRAFRDIALGQNYFDLLGLDYVAPEICQ
jgi:hypothetical protein